MNATRVSHPIPSPSSPLSPCSSIQRRYICCPASAAIQLSIGLLWVLLFSLPAQLIEHISASLPRSGTAIIHLPDRTLHVASLISLRAESHSMAGEKASGNAARTPARAAPKATPASKQRSIVSFFQKSSPATSTPTAAPSDKVSSGSQPSCLQETKANSLPKPKPSAKLVTPVPSSDALEPPSSQENETVDSESRPTTLRSSPTTMTSGLRASHLSTPRGLDDKSPSRKVRSHVEEAHVLPNMETGCQKGRQLRRVLGRR